MFNDSINNNCQTSFYYDNISTSCLSCNGLCIICNSSTFCTGCKENSTLTAENSCECKEGYSGIDNCFQKNFKSYITINSNDVITLVFTELLNKTLTKNDFLIKINNVTQDFILTDIDGLSYIINIAFIQSVNKGDTLIIIFQTPIYSKNNLLLEINNITSELFPYTYEDTIYLVNQATLYAQSGMTVGIAASASISILNFNPITFFHFLNSAEIYTYIIIYQLDLDESLIEFLKNLNFNSKAPNLFTYIIDENNGESVAKEVNGFGFKSNLLMRNSGLKMTILVCVIALLPFVCILTKIKCI